MGGKALIWVLLSACTACTEGRPWDFPVDLYTNNPNLSVQVETAAQKWDAVLESPCGYIPFNFQPNFGKRSPGPDTIDVELIDVNEWDWDETTAGMTTNNGIFIRSDQGPISQEVILAHELGHAMGLKHSDDIRSVMYFTPLVRFPNQDDIALAIATLGCQ